MLFGTCGRNNNITRNKRVNFVERGYGDIQPERVQLCIALGRSFSLLYFLTSKNSPARISRIDWTSAAKRASVLPPDKKSTASESVCLECKLGSAARDLKIGELSNALRDVRGAETA
jgi:hypothetical protein